MKTTSTRLLMAGILCFLAINLFGQAMPYKNGFENATENSSWTKIKNNSTAVNEWVIDTTVRLSGRKSLYISYNGGVNVGYETDQPTVAMAYRSLTMPTGGTYSFFLDYRNNSRLGDTLFICWVDDPAITMPTTTNGVLPAWVRTTAKRVETNNSMQWKNASFTVCGGTTGKLVFVWKNQVADPSLPKDTVKTANIVIDNIQINKNSYYSYYSGFDEPNELDGWVFYNSNNVQNKWVVGSAISLSGSKSLYISTGNSNKYTYNGNSEGYVSVLKEFVLPEGEFFNIEFDYMSAGDASDFMYVAWLDNATDSAYNRWTNNQNTISNVIKNAVKPTAGLKYNKKATWTHAAFQVVGKGRPAKIVFLWVNNSSKTHNPPAAIDNFTIKRGIDNTTLQQPILPAVCATPIIASTTSVGGGIVVTWDDDRTSVYELSYRNTFDTIGAYHVIVGDVASPYTINGLAKGAYSVLIRKVCNNSYTLCGTAIKDTSAYATSHHNIVLTGDGCINYGDLNNSATVTATYGSWGGASSPALQAFQNVGVIPGRHTLVMKPEYDPRTLSADPDNPGLLTIPYGELATIKLGNEVTGAECEGLTYNLHVDPKYALLIMKYAVVLEDPDHVPANQPRFKLDILDNTGTVISPTCGSLEFVAGSNTPSDGGWTFMGCPGSDCVKWKNWTTIGLNLKEYANRDIKIRLSTWDCEQSGHYGYAYFMLNCVAQQFSGFSCRSQATDTIYAPEGFAYCWFKKYNANGTIANTEHDALSSINCLSTKRGFAPTTATDTSTYICKIMLKTEQGTQEACYFGLTAKIAPRIPEARYSHQNAPANCINYVQFTDNSIVHVGRVGGPTEQPTSTKWIVRANNQTGVVLAIKTDKNPKIEFPPAGGTFNVSLITGFGTGEGCSDTVRFDITVPPIGDMEKTQKTTTCFERLPYLWRGKSYSTEGIYREKVPQANGCDSVYILDLKIAKAIEVLIDTTICNGQSIDFRGKTLNQTGVYSDTLPTSVGCDSIIKMTLTVNPIMQMAIVPLQTIICSDDPDFAINYGNTGGTNPTTYTLKFTNGSKFEQSNGSFNADANNKKILIPMPADIRPDRYDVEIDFVDSVYKCPSGKINVPFEVRYPSKTIEQNWNDVIAVLNSRYNGGYEFSAYQWYKNGSPINGETKSYLYVPNGLETGAEYAVHLRRNSEDYSIFTCIIKPQQMNSNIIPTVSKVSATISLYPVIQSATVNIYTTTGILVSSQKVTPEHQSYIAPSTTGVYIVNILQKDGSKKVFKIVVGH